MAEAIPVADAGLLAAQAQSGLAGVAAYKQAQDTLASQKQAAVQTAMQEAALRGAPAGAMASQQSIITAPYDQRLASLAQGQAGFQADMAARDRRMQDYNAATLQARTLIPGEVEKVVAPIRARGEAAIANTTRQGEMAVSEIDANTRLALAKMAAAEAAAQAAARKAAAEKAAKEKTLSGAELSAMLANAAQARMNPSFATAGQMVSANEAAEAEARDKATNDLRTGVTGTKIAPKNPAVYTTSFGASAAPKAQQATTQAYGAKAAVPIAQGTGMQPPANRVTMPFGHPLAPGVQAPANPMPFGHRLTPTVQSNDVARQIAAQRAGVASKLAGTQGPLHQFAPTGATPTYSLPTGATAAGSSSYAPFNPNPAIDTTPFESQYGSFSAEQYQQLLQTDPYLASLLNNAPEGITSKNIGRYLFGEPDDLGQPDPYAVQATRWATEAGGQDLIKQGYNISPQDYQNAVTPDMKPGETFFAYQQRVNGQLSSGDQAKAIAAKKAEVRGDITWQHTQQQWLRDNGRNNINDAKTAAEWSYYMDTHNSDGSPIYDADTGLPATASPAEGDAARTKGLNQQATTQLANWGVQIPSALGGAPADWADIVYAGSSGLDPTTGAPDGPFFKVMAKLEASQDGPAGDLSTFNDWMNDDAIKGYKLTPGQRNLIKSIWYKPKTTTTVSG